MPNFSLSFTRPGLPALTPQVWADLSVPPRINPLPGCLHRYWSVPVGCTLLRFSCTVGGVFEPLDAALGGHLFLWSWVECPLPLYTLVPVVGQSSVATVTSPGLVSGRYLALAWRDHGGSVALPFIVE